MSSGFGEVLPVILLPELSCCFPPLSELEPLLSELVLLSELIVLAAIFGVLLSWSITLRDEVEEPSLLIGLASSLDAETEADADCCTCSDGLQSDFWQLTIPSAGIERMSITLKVFM